ncbi:hypothetical protein [Eoetvoesiella caeni]
MVETKDIERAKAIVFRFHHAVMAKDRDLQNDCALEYSNLVIALNGGTNLGCMVEGAPGHSLTVQCAAQPGEEPIWGQEGEFLLSAHGVTALVRVQGDVPTSRCAVGFSFHALDPYLPFLSPTGYRSAFTVPTPGKTVKEVAVAIMGEILETKKNLCMVEGTHHQNIRVPAWIVTIPQAACTVNAHGQLGLF